MTISIEDIKKLRDSTGVSMTACKKALEESEGDMDKAFDVLRKKGESKAAERSERSTANGAIAVKVSGEKAVLLALQCETDFVARGDDFRSVLETLVNKALSGEIKNADEDLNEVKDAQLRLGENIKIGELKFLEAPVLGFYVHSNDKLASVVGLEGGSEDLAKDIRKTGEEAIHETGIAGVDPKLVQLLGRLKYRTSYGQNVLTHSIEVAHLSAMLAEELGADVNIARKAGLFHDIGKAVDFEIQGTHPEIGKNLGEKYGLSKEVVIPIATHHDDHPPTLEAVIVKVADAISGSRPGARKDNYEDYLKRLDELESIAKKFKGVDKTYAIQAGRELRVFVKPEEIDDLASHKLARQIADQIEEDLKYPGEIKVTIIRESRINEYAK